MGCLHSPLPQAVTAQVVSLADQFWMQFTHQPSALFQVAFIYSRHVVGQVVMVIDQQLPGLSAPYPLFTPALMVESVQRTIDVKGADYTGPATELIWLPNMTEDDSLPHAPSGRAELLHIPCQNVGRLYKFPRCKWACTCNLAKP